MSVPTNLIPTLISGLPEYAGSSTLGYLPYVLEGRTYKVQFSNIAAVGAVPSSRVIAAGTGLAGGGDLSENRVISIAAGGVGFDQLALSGVVAGTYGSGSAIPILTVDSKGRVTSASTVALDVTGFVPTSRTITAGDGLTGGGSLANNITLAANFSATTPSALGTASAGTSIAVSRGDHVHPAVNLSDTTQTQGALPLGRGGTGDALSPVAGAVVYSTGTKFALTNPGLVGQVLVSNGTDEPQWQTIAGAGTVTSVNASGGATGLSFTGGPITVSGTLTLGGTLAVASGGTGATDAATALTNLGAYPASNPAGYTSNVGTVTSVSGTGTVSGLSLSGTVTSAGSLTLGGALVVTPSDFASQSANTVLAAPNGSAGVPTFRAIVAADIPTLNQNTTGTASNVTGIVAVANGGTGASVAGTARTNLGAAASGANTDITSIALTTGTISATPSGGTDIVNKAYADSIASGINFHQSVRLATAAALPANTYNNGASGVGATLTANANGALSVDGVAVAVGNRILVKNEVAQANNGVYTVTQVGDGSTPYILTRATDFDSSGSGVDQIDAGDFFLVTAGSTQSNTSWVQQTPLPITVGTTAIVFTQFAAPVLYSAGTGLTLAGTVFSITNTGVSASTYGSASSVPVLAINAQGQVTSASSSSIAIAASQITSGTVTVAQGGTGATTLGANGVLLGNGTSAISATAVGATGQVLVGNTGGAPSWATLSGIGVTSFSAGTTGLTPSSATTGAITLAGTLNVANGGTGATSLTSGYLVKGNGTSAVSASVVYDTGTNVGIGTSSPASLLHVDGGVSTVGRYGSSGAMVLRSASGSQASPTAISVSTTLATTVARGYDGSAYRDVGTISFVSDGAISSSSSPGYIQFNTTASGSTSATERMRIDSAGNVGIGTSAPSTAQIFTVSSGGTTAPTNGGLAGVVIVNTDLTTAGTSGILSNLADPSGTGRHSAAIAFGKDGTWTTGSAYPGNIQFWTRPNSTAGEVERMRIDSSGNVGIGTTSPASLGTLVVSKASSGTPIIALESQGSWNASISANSSGNLIFSNNAATERMRIDSAGNVGIGTTSPTAKVQVFSDGPPAASGNMSNGLAVASAAGSFAINIGANATGGYTWLNSAYINASSIASPMVFMTGAAERMRIDSSGNVGIGTSSIISEARLQVVGGAIVGQRDATGTFGDFDNRGQLILRGATNVDKRLAMGVDTSAGTMFGVVQAIEAGVSTRNLALNPAGGNVGIGTTAPASLLHVKRGSNATEVYPSGTWASRVINATDASGENGLVVGNRWAAPTSTVFEVGSIFGGGTGSWFSYYKVEGSGNSVWSSGGAEVMRLAGSNLGIGTSPVARLDVLAGSNQRLLFTERGTGGSVIDSVNAANNAYQQFLLNGSPVIFATNATERMRITSSGFVGVGTSAPGAQFENMGQTRLGANVTPVAPSSTDILSTSHTALGGNGGNYLTMGLYPGAQGFAQWVQSSFLNPTTAVYNLILQPLGGNVGIGNSGPGYRLDVAAGDTTSGLGYGMRLRANATANGGSFQFTDSAVTAQWAIITANSSEFRLTADGRPLTFYTGGAERMRIDSSGRVLVGSTSTSYAYADTSMRWIGSGGGLMLSQNSTGDVNQMVFFNPNGQVGFINTNGTATSYGTSSDARLKENIVDADDAANLIDAIQVRKFDWKVDGTHQRYGFIAQELIEVAPEAVSQPTGPDAMMGVDYSKLVPMLIKEVQSLRARVAQLEGN